MNDPHVVALHYNLLIGPGVDFTKTPPLRWNVPEFEVWLETDKAKFTMKRHFATEQDARNIVQPFVDAWNISAGLDLQPNRFRLEYSHPEIVDRSPAPGVLTPRAGNLTIRASEPSMTIAYSRFPSPPTNFQASPDVSSMYSQYRAQKEGGIPLAHVAYFVLTVLEGGTKPFKSKPSKKREAAAKKFAIDVSVLDKIGELTSTRGGLSARKFNGLRSELKPQEILWLEEVTKMMIRRAGEIEANPTGSHQQITMAKLPPL